jgi:hypothetical protein
MCDITQTTSKHLGKELQEELRCARHFPVRCGDVSLEIVALVCMVVFDSLLGRPTLMALLGGASTTPGFIGFPTHRLGTCLG